MTQVNVKFAGQQYTVEKQMTPSEMLKMQRKNKNTVGGQNTGLDSLVHMIDNQDKNINAYQKTKMDWDKYTKEEKLEADFEKNRKDGYLQKKAFLDKVSDVEYQHKKKIEKHQLAVRSEQLKLG